MRRKAWIYKRLVRNWIRSLQQRRELHRKLEALTDHGFLDRIK